MTALWFFLAGLFAGIAFLGEPWRFALAPAFACVVLAVTARRGQKGRIPATRGLQVPRREPGQPAEEPRRDTQAFLRSDLAALGEAGRTEAQAREARRSGLRELEESVDAAMLDGLALLKQGVEGGHTYAAFFPGKTEGLFLRVWITDSQALIPGALLGSNQGLVGQLLKDGVKRVLEGDIVAESTRLHYYSRDEGVRSLAGVPILVKGARRGAIIVDSLRPNAFDEHTVERLEGLANLVGHMAFHAYLAFEYSIHKEQLAALTSYQRKFLENMSVENIVTHAQRYMEEHLEGDRFLVLGRQGKGPATPGSATGRADPGVAGFRPPGGDEIKVIACKGENEDDLRGFIFSLAEKGLLGLAFEKEQVINRGFEGSHYVPRMSPREKANPRLTGLLAVPVPTDQGVDMVLAVESLKLRRFSDHQQNMLATIARAAGFALSRARLYQEKEQLASRDGLTGVQNHRSFQERFQSEILRAQRYDQQLAVLMMDIDFFKKVNDSYGHPAGDAVLKEVARIISENVRAGIDVLARYGGEEFVCMLADTDRARAGETAERIRENIAAKVFESGQTHFQVTLSIGAAIFPVDARHGREVLEKADKALYRAKETGRNRLVFYN